MIVHIVMFKIQEESKKKKSEKAKKLLLGLVEKIDVLCSMEVGINFDESERAFDLSLYAKFKTKEDLEAYAKDPAHLEVVAFIKTIALESKVVDYLLE